MPAPALFPADWVPPADGDGPADDLALAVLLVNSLDHLADPPDRLASIGWYAAVLRATGHGGHAAALRPADLPRLRILRDGLRATFLADTAEAAAAALNPLLLTAGAIPVLVAGPGGSAGLAVAPGAAGALALAARLPGAVAGFIARHGLRRLGSCAARPCACVFVDRTRAASRRYCCDLCNDRAAASAYRRRQSLPHQVPPPRA
jgi:predicted RNA-binding Zn ribbon-like protein